MADKDRDGIISLGEFREFVQERRSLLRDIFDEVDTGKDGYLGTRILTSDERELTQAFQRVGQRANHVQIAALMDAMENHEGKIGFEEFVDFLIFLPSISKENVFLYFQSAGITPSRQFRLILVRV